MISCHSTVNFFDVLSFNYKVQLCNLRWGLQVSKKVRKSVTLVNAIDYRFIFVKATLFCFIFQLVRYCDVIKFLNRKPEELQTYNGYHRIADLDRLMFS